MKKSVLSRLEKRAWDIMYERAQKGKEVDFIVAYAAAIAEQNRRRRARRKQGAN